MLLFSDGTTMFFCRCRRVENLKFNLFPKTDVRCYGISYFTSLFHIFLIYSINCTIYIFKGIILYMQIMELERWYHRLTSFAEVTKAAAKTDDVRVGQCFEHFYRQTVNVLYLTKCWGGRSLFEKVGLVLALETTFVYATISLGLKVRRQQRWHALLQI